MQQKAIITGDIVSSQRVEPADRAFLYDELQNFLRELKERKLLAKYEPYRGDSFQCEVKDIQQALRTALIIKCFIKTFQRGIFPFSGSNKRKAKIITAKHIDIRLSIGIGSIDFIKRSLSVSDGEAFRYSGEGFDKLKNSNQQLYLKTGDEKIDTQNSITVVLLDAIIQKYYSGQAEVVLFKLLGLKEDDIATELGITQSAVNQRAKSAFWYAIEKAVSQFEKTIQEWH